MSTSLGGRDPLEKARGALLGAALGDAAGWPQEPIARRLGKRSTGDGALLSAWERRSGTRFLSYTEPIAAGQYSDDTQLILCTARSLLDGDRWFRRLVEVEIPTWTVYERGGGGATKRAAACWLAGMPPWSDRDADVRARYLNAGGAGVAMRVLPHSLTWRSHGSSDMVSAVFLNGTATHGHPRALVGAALHAFVLLTALQQSGTLAYGELVERAIEGRSQWSKLPIESAPEGWLGAVNQQGREYETSWNAVVAELDKLLALAEESMHEGALALDRSVLDRLGATTKQSSGAGTVNAVAALYLASRYAAEPMLGLRQAAFAYPADTDTLASMTASILGALHGTDWMRGVVHQLQDSDYIASFAAEMPTSQDASAKSESLRRVTERDCTEAENALVSMEIGASWSLPDGRQGEVQKIIPLNVATSSAKATMWVVGLKDGQTLHVIKTSRAANKPSNSSKRSSSNPMDFLPVREAHAGIRLPVDDVARSVRFYSHALGLRVTQESANAVRLDGFLSLVLDTEKSLLPPSTGKGGWRAIVHIQSPSIAHVWANVRAFRGLPLGPISFVGSRQFFRCEDPDGNIVEVVEASDGKGQPAEEGAGQLGLSFVTDHSAASSDAPNGHPLTLAPNVVGNRILLSVTNHSNAGAFSAQVTGVDGSEEQLPVPWALPWQDSKDEFRSIQTGQTQVLVLAEGDGMGFPPGTSPPTPWQPAAFWFESSNRRFRARFANLRSTTDIYTRCLKIRVELRDAPGRVALSREVELGFENANDPMTGNLRVRANLHE